tara:strand:+ start:18 stop:752 length:735 start_codon:yes stop_codon:yes gene_type:complete
MDLITPYTCPDCNKCYQRYSFFSRHVLICNSSHISKNNSLPDSIKYPSQIQQTLDYLISSNNELREQLKKIQSEKQIEKRKINILSWLNKNHKPEIDYNSFIQNLKLDIKYLHSLQENNIKIVIKEIFDNYFSAERENFCFKAFAIKTNKLYVFTETKVWKELTYDNMKSIISKISLEFLSLLKSWQDENEKKLLCDDVSNTYLKLLKKVNTINLNNISFVKNIYKLLYIHLKTESKIIEYEII